MTYVPEYQHDFEQKFNKSSLAFVLFNLAPPTAALGMLEKGVISDLNELSDTGVSLLALKTSPVEFFSKNDLPSWQHFEEHKENVWAAANLSGANNTNLLLAMMFSGADPWIIWSNVHHKGVDSFFSLMCLYGNAPMTQFLSTHPHFPGISSIEQLSIECEVYGDYRYHNTPKKMLPLLHFCANRGNKPCLKVLLDLGYDPNLKDLDGRTALFYIQDPAIAKYLIDCNASVSIKDKNGITAHQHWDKWLSTAAKKSELNKLVVDHLKERMTIEDIQTLQKPNVLNQILTGSKTAFLSLFRKGRFKSNVEFATQSGTLNLLTVALLRADEKSEMFVRYFDQEGVSWDYTPWKEHPHVTNALIARSLPDVGVHENALSKVLQKYKKNGSDFNQYKKDLLETYEALAYNGINTHKVLKSFFFALNYEHFKNEGQSNANYYAVPHDFKRFENLFSFNQPYSQDLDLMNHETAPRVGCAVLKSFFAQDTGPVNLYINSNHISHFLNTVVDKSEKNFQWGLTLPYILRLIVSQQWNDKSWDEVLHKMLMAAETHLNGYSADEAALFKNVDPKVHPCITPMLSIIQKGILLQEINADQTVASPVARRKM